MAIDTQRLAEAIRKCDVVRIPAGTVLYRGTFEGWPNEYPGENRLVGVKTFAFRRSLGVSYASRDPKQNQYREKIPSDDPTLRSVLFTLFLRESCNVFAWESPGDHYRSAMTPGFTDIFSFERNDLLPLARTALGDPNLAGYVADGDVASASEAVLDMQKLGGHDVSAKYL